MPVDRDHRTPVQNEGPYRDGRSRMPRGTVAWWEHEEAHRDYAKHYAGQDAEMLAARGGFGYWEMTKHLGHEPTTWTPNS